MLTIIPNEDQTAIKFLFRNFFTQEEQFVTEFDLDQCLRIADDLKETIEKIKKRK
jgi:hypothetical protein